MQLRTGVGVIELQVLHGQDPGDQRWGCPIREQWGLSVHQQLSLALAGKWGVAVDDSTLHALTQRLGIKAEAHTQAVLKEPPVEREPDMSIVLLSRFGNE